ncbi:MAG: hypothetical protein ICV51_10045 [Flavisolibacter sp.]|nr:hypothetical protein [Flavisolibacter sp.]MBD0375956.1 hypothetical protein [Flavisolibacter sp.]
MSTLIVALIIVLGIAVVLFLLVFLHNRQNKKRAEKMLRRFSELGSEHDLSFTGQEVFRNHIIGVDGIKRKLLLLENDGTHNHWSVIDLAEVKSCRVKKIYGNMEAGDPSTKSTEMYLRAIVLEFDFENSNPTIALPFYKLVSNSIQEAPELEAKAKNWESVLLKMMTKEVKRA